MTIKTWQADPILPLTFEEIAVELKRAGSKVRFSDTDVRLLAGVPSGPISLDDFYGKTYSGPYGELYDGVTHSVTWSNDHQYNTDVVVAIGFNSNGRLEFKVSNTAGTETYHIYTSKRWHDGTTTDPDNLFTVKSTGNPLSSGPALNALTDINGDTELDGVNSWEQTVNLNTTFSPSDATFETQQKDFLAHVGDVTVSINIINNFIAEVGTLADDTGTLIWNNYTDQLSDATLNVHVGFFQDGTATVSLRKTDGTLVSQEVIAFATGVPGAYSGYEVKRTTTSGSLTGPTDYVVIDSDTDEPNGTDHWEFSLPLDTQDSFTNTFQVRQIDRPDLIATITLGANLDYLDITANIIPISNATVSWTNPEDSGAVSTVTMFPSTSGYFVVAFNKYSPEKGKFYRYDWGSNISGSVSSNYLWKLKSLSNPDGMSVNQSQPLNTPLAINQTLSSQYVGHPDIPGLNLNNNSVNNNHIDYEVGVNDNDLATLSATIEIYEAADVNNKTEFTITAELWNKLNASTLSVPVMFNALNNGTATINPDGTYTTTHGGSGDWLDPGGAVGSQYEIYVVGNGSPGDVDGKNGVVTGSCIDQWTSLATAQNFTVNGPTDASSYEVLVLIREIANPSRMARREIKYKGTL